MDIFNQIWANSLYQRIILSVLILVSQAVLRWLVVFSILNRIPEDSTYFYLGRRITGYLFTILTAVLLFGVWVQHLGDLTIALGILAAGLAFALQEVIGSIAGWLTILSGTPFSIGDRIETGGIRGDVVDIGILRTTLMEIGNWLEGDHNTGRIVTLSNAFIFKEPLYNYSSHFKFLWDEIKVPVTYESDWKRALDIMLRAVKEHPKYQALIPYAERQRREVRRQLAVRTTPLQPHAFTFVKLTDNWIELSLLYPVDTDLRRSFRSEISQQILTDFDSAGITIASATVAIVEFPTNARPKV